MNEAEYFRQKQRQCLRLIKATTDRPAIEGMTALAKEFEAKAEAAEAKNGSRVGLVDGEMVVFSDNTKTAALDEGESRDAPEGERRET